MTARKYIIILSILLIAGLFPSWGLGQDMEGVDDTGASPADTIFTEIELTSEGVVAYDSAGNRWIYDFDSAAFREGDDFDGEIGAGDETTAGTGRKIPPVEVRCTVLKEVKPLQKKVTVGYTEYVDGDITATGQVTIRGWVKGDVQSYSDRVLVMESGRVDGDVEAPKITIKRGGKVSGELIESGSITDLPGDVLEYSFSTGGLWVIFGMTIFLLLSGFVAITLAPVKMGNFTACIQKYPAKSFLLGFLFTIMMPMVIALVAVTIVGILVIAFIPFIYVMAFTLGVVAFGVLVGRQIFIKCCGEIKNDLLNFLPGVGLLMALWLLVALLLGSSDSVVEGFGIFFLVIAIIITSYPICAGVGAAVLTRFGFREKVSFKETISLKKKKAPRPAPPPIPEEPRIGSPSFEPPAPPVVPPPPVPNGGPIVTPPPKPLGRDDTPDSGPNGELPEKN